MREAVDKVIQKRSIRKMSSLKNSLLDRLVSIFLVIAIVFTSLPMGPLAVTATEEVSEPVAETITYTGTVTHVDGTGIQGVTVSPVSATEGASCEPATTDENGAYSLMLTKGAEYTLTFSLEGYVTKTLTLTSDETQNAVSSASVSLLLADNSFGFTNLEGNEITIAWGEEIPFCAAGSTEQSDVVPTYSSSDEAMATVAEDGTVTLAATAKPGEVTITATIGESGNYAAATASYKLIITKATLTDIVFSPETEASVEKSISEGTFTNTASSATLADAENVSTSYAFKEETAVATIDAASGTVTFVSSGTVTVVATISNDYYEGTAEYQLHIKGQEVEGFGFDDKSPVITYSAETNTIGYEVNKGTGTDTVIYSILSETDLDGNSLADGDMVASIDTSTGILTINRSGIVTVQAEMTATEQYEAVKATYTLTINKAGQEPLSFTEVAADYTVKLSFDNFKNVNSNTYQLPELVGGTGNGVVSYSLSSETVTNIADYVELADATNAELTIKKPCRETITITATKAADSCYNATDTSFKITIDKAEQNAISFTDGDESESGKKVALVYGAQTEYTNAIVLSETDELVNKGYSTATATYSYTLPEGTEGNGIVKAFDATTGKITFEDGVVGSVTVTAVIPEDEYYKGTSEISYTLTISYPETPENPYAIDNTTLNADSGWYTGTVTIRPSAGYQISESNSLTSNDWKTALEYEESKPDGVEIYLKDESTGAITEKIVVETFKVDKEPPTVDNIKYIVPLSQTILETITFGLYTPQIHVTVSASDLNSGLKSFTYYSSAEGSVIADQTEVFVYNEDGTLADGMTTDGQGRVSYSFYASVEDSENIAVFATDVAGNASAEVTAGEIEEDGDAPQISIQIVDDDETLNGDGDLTNQSVKATLTVTEKNFASEYVDVVVKKDGSSVELSDANGTSSVVSSEIIDNATVWTNTITFKNDGTYEISVTAADRVGNTSETTKTFEIDKTSAMVEEEHKDAVTTEGDETTGYTYYYGPKDSDTVEFPIAITEKNFNDDNVKIFLDGNTEENVATAMIWEQDATDANIYRSSIAITGEGEHTFVVKIVDEANNETEYQSQTIVIDKMRPEVSIELFTENGESPEGYEGSLEYPNNYKETIVARVTVDDNNIAPEQTIIIVNGENKVYSKEDWEYKTEDRRTYYYCDIEFAEDNFYTISARAVDKAGLDSAEIAQKEFAVDKTPVNMSDMTISYSEPVVGKLIEGITFGYYKSHVEVTLTATDNLTGIDSFAWTYTRQDGSSEGNVETSSGTISITDKDFKDDGKTATAKFRLTASDAEQFRGSVKFYAIDKAGHRSEEKQGGERISIVDSITPGRTVTYSPAKRVVDKTTYQIIENYQYDSEGNNAILYYDGNITATFTVAEMNFYPEDTIIKVNNVIQDTSGWKQNGDVWTRNITLTGDGAYTVTMEYKDRSGNVMNTYTSELLVIDTVKPTVGIELLDSNGEKAVYQSNENYFNQAITAKINVTDVNFALEEAVITVNNQKLETSAWKQGGIAGTWYCMVPLSADNYYDVKVDINDRVDKPATASQSLCVDKTRPGADRMTIEYSGELNKWEKVLNAITFGYYAYAKEVEVTLTAWDDMSGIDYFVWSYTKEADTSNVNVVEVTEKITRDNITYSESGRKAVAKIKLTASELEQYRGNISFTATDWANNSSVKNDNERINIVDTITPTRMVTYTQAKQVLDASTMKTKAEYQYDAENTNSILYYDGDVTATFTITEANFYPEDVVVKVNGTQRKDISWNQDGDVWTGILTLSGDGDYTITMEYMDRSNNTMTKYTSDHIVIDTINPVIEVVYGNTNIQNALENREYYNDIQTATITITERNFRASDVVANVTAKDIEDNAIVISNYAEYLSNKDNWKQNGDSYTATVVYSVEANYEFDIAYCDLAKHDAKEYETDHFTVDRTAPQNISITYSQSLLEEIIEAITFGFYDANVTVTITAEDIISGINEVRYSALSADGVSAVNVEVIEALLAETEIQKSGRTGTVEIRVPSNALSETSQFHGTIECKVSDRSKNTADSKGDKRLIVDNIAPTMNVTFNESVKEVNEVAYYDGDITVTMEVTEANFYEEDFVLQVTRDGAETAVSPSWTDESTDIHIGTFTLHEDGDYLITADYTDKSTNQMEQYKSSQLTIDTEEPTISISEIQPNEASKEEVYGFTITADDTNFDVDTFEAVLEAIVQDEVGNFRTKEISLGAPQTIEEGKTYAYIVENLEEDAIYTLSCTVSDMANHTKSVFLLEDGNEYENVQFSINRNGSNFMLDSATEEVVENYYIYSMNEDIVIQEINVNPVEIYAVRMNGELLTENDTNGYETILSGGGDEWSQRTYIISKNLFEEEGTYNITVESTDKTETVAYSDVKNAAVEFVIDKSAPIVTISGLESNAVYETYEQEVIVMPTDEGGRLNSFTAIVLDSDGKPIKDSAGNDISKRIALEGEALLTHLSENNGKIVFTIPEGFELQVQIICTDCAVHENGSTNEYNEIFEKITVTQSELLMFYANKPLLYGTVASVTVPVAGLAGFIIRRRRKKLIK